MYLLRNGSLLFTSPPRSGDPEKKGPSLRLGSVEEISFLSEEAHGFNGSSDYHCVPLRAFPVCRSGRHQGLCYQKILLASPLLKQAFPPWLQGHSWWLGWAQSQWKQQHCLSSWPLEKCRVVGQGRNAKRWAENPGFGGSF